MKRREFLKAAGVGLAASTAVAAPAIAQSTPTIKWRMPSSWPKSLDTIYGGAETMCKAVAEATDNKFQIQIVRAGEIVPGLPGRRRGAERHRRDRPHRVLLLLRQGPDLRLRHLGAVRPERRASTRPGGRRAAARTCSTSSTRSTTATALLAGNTGCQMGGWFRKEINTVDDLKGLKMRDRRLRRQDPAEARRRAAADRRRRHLSGAGEGHASTPPNGSVRTTTRSSASTRSRRTTTIPAGGKAARCCSPSSTSTSGTRCRSTIRRCSSRPAHYANTWMMAKYDDAQSAGAAAAGRRRRQAARVLAGRSWTPASRRRMELHAEVAQEQRELQEGL